MIDQLLSLALVLQQYFITLCNYITFNAKRLASLGFSSNRKFIGDGAKTNGTSCPRSSTRQRTSRKQNGVEAHLKPCSEIPGPRCLPLVGTLFDFNKFGPKYVHELAKDHHEKFGDIFRERIFTQEMVFVASTDLLKQWMSQEGKLPVSLKQEPSIIFSELYPQFKRGLFFRNGEEWAELRKLGHGIVNKNAADFDPQGLFDGCQDFIAQYLNNMRQAICDGSESGMMVDLENRAYEIGLGVTIRLVYGQRIDAFEQYTETDLQTIIRNLKELNICNQKLLEMPARVAKLLGLSVWKDYSSKLYHNLSSCITYGQKLQEEILKFPEEASMRKYGLLYKSMQLNFPTQDIDDMLCDFAVDSKDSFAGTLMFITQVLAAHPDIQDKIHREIALVYSANQPITHSKLKYLEYTKGFCKEVLRLYPVAAFTARVISDSTVLGGYQIPPGTMLMYSTYVAHRDPRYFSDPLRVLPERWLVDQKSNGSGNPTCDQNAFAAFGLNQRLCLGQNIATSLFILFTANIVRAFKLKTDGMPEVEMKTVLYPAHPENPIYLTVR